MEYQDNKQEQRPSDSATLIVAMGCPLVAAAAMMVSIYATDFRGLLHLVAVASCVTWVLSLRNKRDFSLGESMKTIGLSSIVVAGFFSSVGFASVLLGASQEVAPKFGSGVQAAIGVGALLGVTYGVIGAVIALVLVVCRAIFRPNGNAYAGDNRTEDSIA